MMVHRLLGVDPAITMFQTRVSQRRGAYHLTNAVTDTLSVHQPPEDFVVPSVDVKAVCSCSRKAGIKRTQSLSRRPIEPHVLRV
jgi:hypothetical protein